VRLLQRMDTLEHKHNHFRARKTPRHSTLGSNNHISRNYRAGPSSVDQEGGKAEPIDIEDNVQSQVEIQDELVNNSTT
jgi:hypothetical protein